MLFAQWGHTSILNILQIGTFQMPLTRFTNKTVFTELKNTVKTVNMIIDKVNKGNIKQAI